MAWLIIGPILFLFVMLFALFIWWVLSADDPELGGIDPRLLPYDPADPERKRWPKLDFWNGG